MGHSAKLEIMENDSIEHDREEIMAAIISECEAFYRRDLETWSAHWTHHNGVHRLCMVTGGHPDYRLGWASHHDKMNKTFQHNPIPNLASGALVRRENFNFRICGDMAWVTFDQITPDTEDPLIHEGLSREMRIFERHNGKWLHAFISNHHSSLPALSSPTIALDGNAQVLWVNEPARTRIRDWDLLKIINNRLFTHSRTLDKAFHALIRQVDDLTIVDLMAGARGLNPIGTVQHFLIEDPTSDRVHIVWIRKREDMVLVSFEDKETLMESVRSTQKIYGLSKTQAQVAYLIAQGCDLPSAAETLDVSVNTVRTHLNRIYEKMRVNSQSALVRELLKSSAPLET